MRSDHVLIDRLPTRVIGGARRRRRASCSGSAVRARWRTAAIARSSSRRTRPSCAAPLRGRLLCSRRRSRGPRCCRCGPSVASAVALCVRCAACVCWRLLSLLLGSLRLRLGPVLLPRLLPLGALLLRRLAAFGPLLLPVLRAIAALLDEILAMILPVFAGVFAVVVVVVPGVVVHVGAAVPSVRTVVVVVVHRRANRDAGGESDQTSRDRHVGVVVLLDDHGRGRRRLRVDDLRVVLRDVDDLRIGRLDHDHFLAGRRRLGLDLLLRRASSASRRSSPAAAAAECCRTPRFDRR